MTTKDDPSGRETVGRALTRLRECGWAAAPLAPVLLALRDSLTGSRVLYVRDMSFLFWPIHRWFGDVVRAGESPLWDPYIGFGQPAISDAVRQMLFPPVLLIRLLLPDALGFNLTVVVAVVVAAIGAYVLARRRMSAEASAFGAAVFALSGPVMSGGNMLITLWSVSMIPWAVWAADRVIVRVTIRRCALLSAGFGLLVLAGEPVTMVSGVALTMGFTLFSVATLDWKPAGVVFGAVTLSGLAGLGLAAMQVVPLLESTRRSARGIEGVPDILASHPLALIESVAGPVFGDPLAPWTSPQPWLAAMNDGNDPYVYSLYIGLPVLVLAILGAGSGCDRKWKMFWSTAAVVAILCALGRHTFVYPLLKALVPLLESFRYPSKYMGVAALAVAMLAATGYESLRVSSASVRARAAATAASFLVALAAAIVWGLCAGSPDWIRAQFEALAALLGIQSIDVAELQVIDALGSAVLELSVVGAVTGILLILSAGLRGRGVALARPALVLLAVLAVTCLLVRNGSLNPTIDAGLLSTPEWVSLTRSHPQDRVFAPGRIALTVGRQFEPGIPRGTDPHPETSSEEVEAVLNESFSVFPAVNRVREGVSADVSRIWTREYTRAMRAYAWSTANRRSIFLERTATRFVIARDEPAAGSTELYSFENYPLHLYEVAPPLPRAFIVGSSTVLPNPDSQTERLFDPSFDPRAMVLLEREATGPAGRPSTEFGTPAATIEEDGTTSVTIRASLPEGGGFVVLHDSWDPYWTSTVDGEPAEVLRANGLFRAVHVSAGEHLVRFSYRPTPFYVGLAVTVLTVLLMAALCATRLGGRPLYTPAHGQEEV